MRISDWSSDVCSSDLCLGRLFVARKNSDANGLARSGRQRHDATDHLVSMARIHAQIHGDFHRLVELGGRMLLHQSDRLINAMQLVAVNGRLESLLLFRQLCHRSEEHTSELQSLMRISYAVFCLKKKKTIT